MTNDLEYFLQLQFFEKDFKNEMQNKDFLINQTFLAWYLLLESEDINQDEKLLSDIVSRNYLILKEIFSQDHWFNFIIGWMMGITPWYFNSDQDSTLFLKKA